jgi:hypothetical protein
MMGHWARISYTRYRFSDLDALYTQIHFFFDEYVSNFFVALGVFDLFTYMHTLRQSF